MEEAKEKLQKENGGFDTDFVKKKEDRDEYLEAKGSRKRSVMAVVINNTKREMEAEAKKRRAVKAVPARGRGGRGGRGGGRGGRTAGGADGDAADDEKENDDEDNSSAPLVHPMTVQVDQGGFNDIPAVVSSAQVQRQSNGVSCRTLVSSYLIPPAPQV